MTNNILFDSTSTQYLKFIDDSATRAKIVNLLLSYGVGGEAIASDVSVEINNYIAIAAIPSEGYLFEKWLVDGVEYLTNPLLLLMNKDKEVVASFIQNALTLYLEVFNSVPNNHNGTYYFKNYGSGNDAEIKNIKVAEFPSTAVYVTTPINMVGQTPIDIELEFILKLGSGVNRYLIGGKPVSTAKGMLLTVTAVNVLSLFIGNGTTQQSLSLGYLSNNGYYNIKFNWNGLIGGIITITINNIVSTYTATHEWIGFSAAQTYISYTNGGQFTGSFIRAKLVHNGNQFEYIFNKGQNSIIDDISGNDNNGTVTGANLTTFWGSTANNIQPYELTKGATLYQVTEPTTTSAELITNGNFDTNVNSWVGNNANAIPAWENGKMRATNIADWAYITQNHNEWVVGEFFKIEFDLIENNSTCTLHIGTGTGGNTVNQIGHYKVYLTSTSDKVFQIRPLSAGVMNILIDNISVVKINAIPFGIVGSIMPICYNKPEEIVGYTRLGYFPPNSGALKGLPNKYSIVGCSPAISDGDYTADELAAIDNPNVIIEQNANTITKFKVYK